MSTLNVNPQGSLERVVSLPLSLAEDIVEELYELRGERAWWADEPRCNYQVRHDELCKTIDKLSAAIRQANTCVSDGPADAPESTRSAEGPFAARNG